MTGDSVWLRRLTVEIAGLAISDPQIAIDLRSQASPTPSAGSVTLWNLSPGREKQIQSAGGGIRVHAGYGDDTGEIFSGVVQRVRRIRESLARKTVVTVGSAFLSPERLSGVSARSYEGEISARQVFLDLASDLGLPVRSIDAIPAERTLDGFVWDTKTTNGMSRVLDELEDGLTWYEDRGGIYVTKPGHVAAGTEEIALSPETSLIGSPTPTDDGARVQSFLVHRARLGCVVDLTSSTLTGRWKAVSLTQRGNNRIGSFQTRMELRAL